MFANSITRIDPSVLPHLARSGDEAGRQLFELHVEKEIGRTMHPKQLEYLTSVSIGFLTRHESSTQRTLPARDRIHTKYFFEEFESLCLCHVVRVLVSCSSFFVSKQFRNVLKVRSEKATTIFSFVLPTIDTTHIPFLPYYRTSKQYPNDPNQKHVQKIWTHCVFLPTTKSNNHIRFARMSLHHSEGFRDTTRLKQILKMPVIEKQIEHANLGKHCLHLFKFPTNYCAIFQKSNSTVYETNEAN